MTHSILYIPLITNLKLKCTVEFCSTMRLHVKKTTDEDKSAHLECMCQQPLFKVLHGNGVNLGKMHKIYAKKFLLVHTEHSYTCS